MPRYTPILNRKMAQASSSGEVLLAFITITHPRSVEIIRLVLAGYDYLVEGNLFNKAWMEIGLLEDTYRPSTFQFQFPNVDRRQINLLRSVVSPPRLTLELTTTAYFDLSKKPREPRSDVTFVWSNQPPDGVLSYRARGLFITDTSASSSTVQGTVRSWDYRQEEWPSLRAKESLLPGTYAR
jgi:hypothetical protein